MHPFGALFSRPARSRCTRRATLGAPVEAIRMIDKRLLEEFGDRVSNAVRHSPAQDLEKNLRALLLAFLDRFDLVAREDLEVQKRLLECAQLKLAALEGRVAELESGAKPPGA
jgi:ubiquinone biosynthesis accessory factor UbiK